MVYQSPGVYITQNNVPNAVNVTGVPALIGIVGAGSRQKTVANEEKIRGAVVDEVLTVAGTPPHVATLSQRSTRSLQDTTIYRDGTPLSDAFVDFNAPFVLGTAAGPFDVTVNNAVGISLDSRIYVTVRFVNGAPGTTVLGSQVTVSAALSGAGAAATRAEIAAAINTGLNALSAVYGASYAAVATDATTGIRITSPNTNPSADVRLTDPVANAAGSTLSALATLFGAPAAGNRDAQSIITIDPLVYNAASEYTADYVSRTLTTDALDQTPVLEVDSVGTFQGTGNFVVSSDYQLTGNSIDWSVDATPIFTGTNASTFDLSTNDNLRLSIDGLTAVTIDLNGGGAGVHGYTNPAVPAAATAAEVAANINAILANSTAYGVLYRAVASVSGSFVRLTSPTQGEAGTVEILAPTTLDATQAIFGLAPAALPSLTLGTGNSPAVASTYFVTYEITRPTADYNTQKRFFSLDSARSDLGAANANNPLMCAVTVAFEQGSPSVAVVQVDDTVLPGSPTRQEFATAVAATVVTDAVTELVVLSTSLDVQSDVRSHVELYSSAAQQRWRRAWFGMPRNTSPGDRDTANTFVFRAARTLQVAPNSPGRGRYFLVAPPQLSGVSHTYTLPDATTETVEHDSTILAVACAARRTSLTSVADTIAKKALSGFNTGDITAPWSPAETGIMASQGVMVVSFDGGNLAVLDPVSTEAGGGGVANFMYDNTGPQKDNLTRKLDQAAEANLIGVVPSSLSDFIFDVKLVFGGVISGEIGAGNIGPFRTESGAIRGFDYNRDIDVVNDPDDPTRYRVKYSFYLRYIVLRIDAEYSVDSPFATS